MSTPAVDLAKHLASNVEGLEYLANCFDGPVRPEPAPAVFVTPTGGPPPEARLGELEVERLSALAVRVRGGRDNYTDGLDLARRVRDAAHYAALSGYVDVRVQESEPIYLGQIDDGNPEWSINVETRITEQ